MKTIHDVLQRKSSELHQSFNDVMQEKELGLRELQQAIVTARQLVNRILESDHEAAPKAVELADKAAIPFASQRIVMEGAMANRAVATAITAVAQETSTQPPATRAPLDRGRNVLP